MKTIQSIILLPYWAIRSLRVKKVSGVVSLLLSGQVLSNAMLPTSSNWMLVPASTFLLVGSALLIKR